MRRIGRIVRVAGAGTAVGFLVVAPPAFLLRVIGNPWPPEGMAWDAPLTDGAIFGVLAVLLWILWAQMMLSFAVETYAAVADRAVPVRLPVLGVQQDLARALIGAIISSAAVTPFAAGVVVHEAAASPPPAAPAQTTGYGLSSMGTHGASDATPTAAARDGVNPHPRAAGLVPAGPVAKPGSQAPSTGATIEVQRGDTLWSLAERHLGDGERWSDIAAINLGKAMRDGAQFNSAEAIRPGWRLAVPGMDAAEPTAAPRHVVAPGDTLWKIAETHLGDGARYPEVFRASDDIVQPDGALLTDPDHIEPGWTVVTEKPDSPPGARHETAGSAPAPSQRPTPPSPMAPPSSDARDTPATQDESPPDTGEETVSPGVAPTDASASWLLPGLSAAGALLAGGLVLGLRSRRRDQARVRRPGRATQGPPPEARSADMTVNAVGSLNSQTLALIDETLRELARHHARKQLGMPSLVAVEVSSGGSLLHFAAEVTLEPPWQQGADSRTWHLPISRLEGAGGWVEAPYPLLISVGVDATGHQWLLNLEHAGVVEVVGDDDRGSDFVRHLAAQLAVHPWSQQAEVDYVDLGHQVAALGENIHHHESISDAIARTARFVEQTRARTREYGVDAVTGRAGQADDDVWTGRALLLGGPARDSDASGREAEDRLIASLLAEPGLTGAAAVTVNHGAEAASDTRLVLSLDEAGQLRLQAQGVTVQAVGLTQDEAAACAVLYQHAEQLEDTPMPVDEDATDRWEAYADRAGGVRSEYTLPREDPGQDENDGPAASVLEREDGLYVREAACVPEDLAAVAPFVPATVRDEIEGADPGLGDDLEAWWDPESPRPKVSVLGPVTVRTKGKPLVKNKAIYTELVAYLATRRRTGATRDEVAEAFAWGTDPGRVRKHVNVVRDWLGIDPASGRPFLPHADKAPAAATRGVNAYQLDAAVMLDADLFKRLILRGRARGGATGRQDLQQALNLVEGRPFDQLREGGWNWLFDGERLDQYLAMSVADVAFTLVTHYLADGELASARKAATIGITAAPDEEATRLCMVRVQEAEGNRTEAQRMLLNDVYLDGGDGDLPSDVPERTSEVVREHRWAAG